MLNVNFCLDRPKSIALVDCFQCCQQS